VEYGKEIQFSNLVDEKKEFAQPRIEPETSLPAATFKGLKIRAL